MNYLKLWESDCDFSHCQTPNNMSSAKNLHASKYKGFSKGINLTNVPTRKPKCRPRKRVKASGESLDKIIAMKAVRKRNIKS